MSNFYYCDSCKKPVDLVEKFNGISSDYPFSKHKRCKECGSTNWHAEIDMGKDGYKQVKE